MRKLAAALGVAVGLTLLGMPAAHAQSTGSFVDIASPAYPEQLVRVSGRCLSRGASVRIRLNNIERWAVLHAGQNRRYSFAKRLPRLISANVHTVYAYCNGRLADTDRFRVLRRATTPFNVEPESVRLGGVVRYQGAGCGSQRIIRFNLNSNRLDSTLTRSNWFFRDGARVPSSLPPGSYTANARCQNGRPVGTEGSIVVTGAYPAPTARPSTLGVSTSRVTAGRAISIAARDCEAGVTEARLHDTKLNLVAPTRSGGIFNAGATIPKETPAGTYQLRTRCDGVEAGVATIKVVASAAGQGLTGAGVLPTPRSNIAPGVSIGLALIIAGALVLASIRRRRSNIRVM